MGPYEISFISVFSVLVFLDFKCKIYQTLTFTFLWILWFLHHRALKLIMLILVVKAKNERESENFTEMKCILKVIDVFF